MRTTKKASSNKRGYKDYHSSDYGVEDDEDDYGQEVHDEDEDEFNEEDPNNNQYNQRRRPDSPDSDY